MESTSTWPKEGGRGRPEWKAIGDWGRGLCMFRGIRASMTCIAQNGRPAPSYYNVVEGTNVITGHKCNKGHKCNNIWSQM